MKKNSSTKNDIWTFISSEDMGNDNSLPKEYTAMKLNIELLEKQLKQSRTPEIALPIINQTLITVKLEDSGTMSADLAAKFPNIKSYKGRELNDSSTEIRVDKNSSGVFAMIVREGQTYFINPIKKGSAIYVIYDKIYAVRGKNPFIERVIK